ncbi:histidine kinase dimerization/phosphoacceptor domain -containing protein [Frigidibacter sp. MR17.14]|uniref:sensor histidine kinase n=1 Tax=Frigidibacter sp. MR17.14 TaxID=3126509 RepID=UPI003012FAEC
MFRTLATLSVTPRTPAWRWSASVLAVLVAFILRYFGDPYFPPGFPYLTFFPAVILTTFFAGLWPGIACALACGVLAWYFFIPPYNSFDLTGTTSVALGFYAFICATDIAILEMMRRALTGQREAHDLAAEEAEARRLMFHELQHRVSNNLAAIASLLKIQRRQIADPGAARALDEAVNRINLVARMQRMLHDPDIQRVDFARFLREMAADVLKTSGAETRIELALDARPLTIGAQQATQLGLIATEFIANAVEHGFPGDRRGRLTIRCTPREGDRALLEVADDGPGLPEGFSPEDSRSLGLVIVRQFATQLDAEVEMRNGASGGCVSRLDFPVIRAA